MLPAWFPPVLLFAVSASLGPLVLRAARVRATALLDRLRVSIPSRALVVKDGAETDAPLADLRPGDIVRVASGGVIPVDGTIVTGFARIDESPVVGEALPSEKEAGETVLAGSRCLDGSLEVRTERAGDAAFPRLLDRLRGILGAPMGGVLAAARVCMLVPLALAVAWTHFRGLPLLPLLLSVNPFVLGALASLPPLLVLSRSRQHGVFWKDAGLLRRVARLEEVWLEEGVVLTGQNHVLWFWVSPGEDYGAVLCQAASAERKCLHPIAKAIVKQAVGFGGNLEVPAAVEEVPGHGLIAAISVGQVVVGSPAFLREKGVDLSPLSERLSRCEAEGVDVACVARSGKAVALFALERVPRPDAGQAVKRMLGLGLRVDLLSKGAPARTALLKRTVGIPGGAAERVQAERSTSPVASFSVGWGGEGSTDAAVGAARNPFAVGVPVLGADLRALVWVVAAARAARASVSVALGLAVLLAILSLLLVMAFNLGAIAAAGLGLASTVLALLGALTVLWRIPRTLAG